MKILGIVGARPNFIKIAALQRAFAKHQDILFKTVHTGQHHDYAMSGIFFQQLEMRPPDHFLGVGSGSHAQQTAGVMVAFEKVVLMEKPELVLVVGDVNSTLACALVAVKLHIPVAHVEAGLRSGDRNMPEEINRMITDIISDQLFVTEYAGVENLLKENVPACKIHMVGNVMIDSLLHCQAGCQKSDILLQLNIKPKSYVLITMHRPSNVDHPKILRELMKTVKALAANQTVIFSMHPRTWKNIHEFGLEQDFESISACKVLAPQGYHEFICLTENAKLVITDSGGVQEETTFLRIPCITLRESTERPVTVEVGSNHLLPDFSAAAVVSLVGSILEKETVKGVIPAFWDGKAAERIVGILREKYINSYVCDK